MIERFEHRHANALGLGRRIRAHLRRQAGARQDVSLVLVLAEVINGDLAFEAPRRDHRDFAFESNETFEDHRCRNPKSGGSRRHWISD